MISCALCYRFALTSNWSYNEIIRVCSPVLFHYSRLLTAHLFSPSLTDYMWLHLTHVTLHFPESHCPLLLITSHLTPYSRDSYLLASYVRTLTELMLFAFFTRDPVVLELCETVFRARDGRLRVHLTILYLRNFGRTEALAFIVF